MISSRETRLCSPVMSEISRSYHGISGQNRLSVWHTIPASVVTHRVLGFMLLLFDIEILDEWLMGKRIFSEMFLNMWFRCMALRVYCFDLCFFEYDISG